MSVPKLRFKEFDGAVTKNFIKDIAKTYVGRDLVEDAYSPIKTETHIYPIYSNSVDNEGLYGYYNFQEFNFDNDALTVVGRGAGLGRAFYRQGGFGTIGRLLCLIPKNKSFHPKYLSDYINDRLIIHNESGGIPQLPRSSLENYEVILPSYEEQTKIASFLSAVDEKIKQLTQKHELLSQYKQGMMQKLFSQQIRFKADDGSEFEEWEKTILGKIGIFLKGKGISKADIVQNGAIPCIRYGELYTQYGEVISNVISATNLEVNSLVLSKANDVLIPASGETQIDIATASCVLQSEVALSGDLNIFRTEENGVFLSYLIRSHLKMQIAQLAQGNSVVHLYSSQLKGVQLNLPCLEEQTKIANFLSAIDQKIEVVVQQIKQVKQWKKGLLQQMFV
ncbi:restriction endonuclease subunit S [Acinetobacter nosocomialis]|nr:restriction endonuclease subunit S [Acinetobacter nosocomialis]MDH2593262.1 restriction endonuclease subunit S [Acinetobacter nosocomialis]